MALQEKIIGKSQILELVGGAAEVAANTYSLKIWGLDVVGGGGRPVVRVFVDTPWEGRTIPFVMPETRSQKSKKRTVHPKRIDADKAYAGDVFDTPDDVDIDADDTAIIADSVTQDSISEDMDNECANMESVSIDQCAHISRMMGIALEVEDTFADAWVLEVSSPGLERGFYQLSQLTTYLGHPVDISLEDAHPDHENRRRFRGTVKSVEEDSFTLTLDSPLNVSCSIAWDAVKKARLVHIFPDTTLSKTQMSS